jgi:hypothetical protein
MFLDAIAVPAGADFPGMWAILLLVALVVVFVILGVVKNIRDKRRK